TTALAFAQLEKDFNGEMHYLAKYILWDLGFSFAQRENAVLTIRSTDTSGEQLLSNIESSGDVKVLAEKIQQSLDNQTQSKKAFQRFIDSLEEQRADQQQRETLKSMCANLIHELRYSKGMTLIKAKLFNEGIIFVEERSSSQS